MQLPDSTWPNWIEWGMMFLFLALAIGLPLAGNYLLVLDIWSWIRSLRRALVKVAVYFPEIPAWARDETPVFLQTFELSMPCSEEEVKRAYRILAEKWHPDRGGNVRRFLIIQQHFEKALLYVRKHNRLE